MPSWAEIEIAAAALPAWVWYLAGCAHGVLVALYLPRVLSGAYRLTQAR